MRSRAVGLAPLSPSLTPTPFSAPLLAPSLSSQARVVLLPARGAACPVLLDSL